MITTMKRTPQRPATTLKKCLAKIAVRMINATSTARTMINPTMRHLSFFADLNQVAEYLNLSSFVFRSVVRSFSQSLYNRFHKKGVWQKRSRKEKRKKSVSFVK